MPPNVRFGIMRSFEFVALPILFQSFVQFTTLIAD